MLDSSSKNHRDAVVPRLPKQKPGLHALIASRDFAQKHRCTCRCNSNACTTPLTYAQGHMHRIHFRNPGYRLARNKPALAGAYSTM